MADKRTLLLADEDVVLYADASEEAVHGAVKELWRRLKVAVAAAGPERVDADGEVHARRWRLTGGEDLEDLTVKQRGFIHAAVFPQIADQVRFPDGTRYTAKAWKELFREMFLGDRWVHRKKLVFDRATGELRQAKRATPQRERISTEELNIRQYSEHIDRVIAYAVTELNVVFQFDEREREAVRWKAKKRAKSAATAPAGEAVPA